MSIPAELQSHLETGLTTLARCWLVVRQDGVTYGFTDHDLDLAFEGYIFRADTGMSAKALQQTTGLAVDNTESMGVLSDTAIKESDILAGRYDGAKVMAWRVNWNDTEQRVLQFAGTIGEISRAEGAFNAELRGLSERLNEPGGRYYQAQASGGLEFRQCPIPEGVPGYVAETVVEQVEGQRVFRFSTLQGFDPRWFDPGRMIVMSGAAEGLIGLIKNDRIEEGGSRVIELWDSIRAPIVTGDQIRLEPLCDGSPEMYKQRMGNLIDFRGFPHIPSEDWLMAYPTSGSLNDGGSLVE